MHLVPISGSGGHDWLHKCCTGDTTSQYRFLPEANSTFAGRIYGLVENQVTS
jgi:hypothetical protein